MRAPPHGILARGRSWEYLTLILLIYMVKFVIINETVFACRRKRLVGIALGGTPLAIG